MFKFWKQRNCKVDARLSDMALHRALDELDILEAALKAKDREYRQAREDIKALCDILDRVDITDPDLSISKEERKLLEEIYRRKRDLY